MLDTVMSSLWHQILTRSSLAKALSEVYLSISTSKIAHVFINDTFDVSLQIPQISSISELPTAIEPQMPGVWLTTANSLGEDDGESLDGISLAKHFALLLLDDVDNIVKDIDHEHGPKEVSHPLAEFVQIVKPTMSYVPSLCPPHSLASRFLYSSLTNRFFIVLHSLFLPLFESCIVSYPSFLSISPKSDSARFLQISQIHDISLRRIQVLSRHLIYWRRARAIPPLHRRDTYIVSPNANMRDLPSATQAYAARFPSLPSLPKMLSILSGHPRAYSTLIPSKDHRDAYMEILAWLMKGGWVTQLRIFAWVRVPREIKERVTSSLTREKRLKREEERRLKEIEKRRFVETKDEGTDGGERVDGQAKDSEVTNGGRGGSDVATEPDHGPQEHDDDIDDDNDGDEDDDESEDSTTILLEPHKANHLESRWLDEIGHSLAIGTKDPTSRETGRGTAHHIANGDGNRRGVFEGGGGRISDARGEDGREGRLAEEEEEDDRMKHGVDGDDGPDGGNKTKNHPIDDDRLIGRHGKNDIDENNDPNASHQHGPHADHFKDHHNHNANDMMNDNDVRKENEKGNNGEISSRRGAGEEGEEEMKEAWIRFQKYFNGRHALEKIPVREGMKRKDVWRCLIEFERRGFLVVVRHW